MKIMIGFVVLLPIYLQAGWYGSSSRDTVQGAVCDSLFQQAEIFLSRGSLKSAEASYQKLILAGDEERGNLGLGKLFLIREDWSEARSRLERALRLDPECVEAQYYSAIGFRESGRWRNPLDIFHAQGISQEGAYSKSAECFRWILQRDSTYQDVLYQYALLLKYQEKFGDAMRALCAQLRLKPGLSIALAGVQRLYKAASRKGRISEILDAIPPPFEDLKTYLQAEVLREEGSLSESEAILDKLIISPTGIPPHSAYLSLVRIHAKKRDLQRLEASYWQAVSAIKDESGAFLLFEDLKYILSPQEVFEYLSSSIESKRDRFFSSIWNRRNPTLGSPGNPRLAEHYVRLVNAGQNYSLDRERFSFFYGKGRPGLNFDLNDAGLVYMRHGAPDEIQGLREGAGSEAWLYKPSDTNDQMVFQFFGIDKSFSGGGSTAAPRPMQAAEGYRPFGTPPRPLESPGNSTDPPNEPQRVFPLPSDLIFWDPDYFYVWKGAIEESEFARHRGVDRLTSKSITSFSEGFSSERSEWGKSIKSFNISSTVSAFRDGDRKTMLDVAYVVPGNSLLKEAGDSVQSMNVESGFAIYDRHWTKIVGVAETLFVSRTTTESNTYMRLQQAMVKPDSYYVAVYARPVGLNMVGKSERAVFAPNFWQPQMTMSDLELAFDVRKATDFSIFDKGGLRVVVSPSQKQPTNKPLYLYFELYNPTKVRTRETNLSLDLNIRPLKATSGVFGSILKIFGEKKGYFVASEVERWNAPEVLAKYLVIDVARMNPGQYVVEVTVTDRLTQKLVSRSLNIELVGKEASQ